MQSTQVRCSHILQKSVKSRNPLDRYRNKKITRSEEEAMENIVKIRAQLEMEGLQNQNFAKLAEQYSEFVKCGSAAEGGDLNFFGRGQMQKAFEDVSFALKVGQLSQPIITDSGVHIILRTA